MGASNYDDVLGQLRDAGLVISPRDGLRIGTHKPVRCYTDDDPREKRGWYLLKEWSPSIDRVLIVGSYGVWRGNSNGATKVALPKDDQGRVTPDQRAAMKRVWAEAAKAAELQRKQEADAAANIASRVWAKLSIEGDAPYLVQKGVNAYGLKFSPGGAAVVPLVDAGGRIAGLQILRTTAQAEKDGRPKKEFWPRGLAKKGRFHLLGHQPHWIVLVAEGYATAAALHAATGYPVACAFDAGNLQPVAEALHKRFKRAKILICADDDILGKCADQACKARIALPLHPKTCPSCGKDHRWVNAGVDGASAAAIGVGGDWVAPKFQGEIERIEQFLAKGTKDTDFNDLQRLEGAAVVAAQVATRLSELKWDPPALRAVSSSTTGEGAKLKPLQLTQELLDRYSLVYGAGGAVFDCSEHCLLPLQDMRNTCIRADLHKSWMEHPDRDIVRQDEVGFDPACEDPKITCNLWGGWPTTPKAGSCKRLLELLQYMCSGEKNSKALYDWVLRWVAYPIQHPGAKMKTTIVVHGPQGTGKNLFFESVMAIYGKYGRILDQDALTDKHNDWASRKLFLIADEVVAQAHRFEVKNKLKTLITGTWVRINPKHIAAYDEANHVNLVFLSNETMPVVLEEDDRRHCIIWTPPKKPPEFYKALLAEIAEGGVAALHEYLLHLDLADFNPGTPPPDTEAKRELIGLAQDSPVEFVDALVQGDIPHLLGADDCPIAGLSTDWFAGYGRWCSSVGVKPASLKRFLSAIDKRRGIQPTRKRYTVRSEFEPDGKRLGPHSVLLFGASAPEGADECEWLGGQVQALKNRLNDQRGRVE